MSTVSIRSLWASLVYTCFLMGFIFMGTAGGEGSCGPLPIDQLCTFSADCGEGQACLNGVCHEVCSPPENPHLMCVWCGSDGDMTMCGPWSCHVDEDCPGVLGEVASCEIPSNKGGGGGTSCVWRPAPVEDLECTQDTDCTQDEFCWEDGKCWLVCQPGIRQHGSPCEHAIYSPNPPAGLLVTWDQILSDLVVDDGALVARPLFTANTEEDLDVSIEAFALLLSRLQMSEMIGDCRFVFGDGQAVFAPVYVLTGAEMYYSYDISFVVLAGETEAVDIECDLIGSFLMGDELTPAFMTPDDIVAEGHDTGDIYLVDVSPQYGHCRSF